MNRRQFAFWIGFGLFSLSEKLGLNGLDSLAAAAMRRTVSNNPSAKPTGGEHWTIGGDKEWRWFEREDYVRGDWVLTGTTTPVNKKTGARKPESIAYIDDSLVPEKIRQGHPKLVNLVRHDPTAPVDDKVIQASHTESESETLESTKSEPIVDLDPQLPTEKVHAREGRPPSKWLRSLHADEIRIWLKTVELPEAGVEGMTVWTHLTRDHHFAADHIEGLTEPEMHQLHAAAHYGY